MRSKQNGQYKCGECGRTFKHPMHLGKHQAAHARAGAAQDRSGSGKQPRGAPRGRRQGVGTRRRGKLAPAALTPRTVAVQTFLDEFTRQGSAGTANGRQVGGDHYRIKPIQPWDYIGANGLSYFEGNVIKLVTRWRDKGGVDDLRKAQHYIDKLIELEAGK